MQLFFHGKRGSRTRAPNDDVAQHGGLARVNTKTTACICDTEQSCYGQLTPVKTTYLLTVSRDNFARSGLKLIKVACFSENDRRLSAGFRLDRGLMSA